MILLSQARSGFSKQMAQLMIADKKASIPIFLKSDLPFSVHVSNF